MIILVMTFLGISMDCPSLDFSNYMDFGLVMLYLFVSILFFSLYISLKNI